MIDLLEMEGFLDDTACDALRAELRAASGGAASLLGGNVRTQVRRATRIAAAPAGCEHVKARLIEAKPALERHFGLTLGECEAPQFLRYEAGDFFVPHQDGNTPLIHDDSRFRKISVVIFLSRHSQEPAPDTYGGGSLVLHGPYSGPELRVPLAPPPGTLVAFRAETTHEVTPVTHGERFTIATWFR
jgi:SM-20-related protein